MVDTGKDQALIKQQIMILNCTIDAGQAALAIPKQGDTPIDDTRVSHLMSKIDRELRTLRDILRSRGYTLRKDGRSKT